MVATKRPKLIIDENKDITVEKLVDMLDHPKMRSIVFERTHSGWLAEIRFGIFIRTAEAGSLKECVQALVPDAS